MATNGQNQIKKSYQSINYALRPAKCVERKMLCEGFRHLSSFFRIENYRYIGFGSTYFSDFSLFHKALGITNMISIEKNKEDIDRFEFNKPFKCIELYLEDSNEVLPKLDWKVPTILWLDYDGNLTTSVLNDISVFCAKATPGSFIVVSVNAHADKPNENNADPTISNTLNDFRLNRLIQDVGRERIPFGVSGKDLNMAQKASVLRKIINNTIYETLSTRNGGISIEEEKVNYHQIINFTYQDGAKMLTVGGVIYTNGNFKTLNECEFNNLDFYRNTESEFKIGIPKLTFREIKLLDQKLPLLNKNGTPSNITDIEEKGLKAIPQEDIQNYMQIYRYFPNFAEAEV